MDNTISIVIGSWGSYNECNERALGSKWIKLNDYDSYEDIEEELKNEGFELEGIDEELFIQDIEGLPANDVNWDYMHPERLFNILKTSEVLDHAYTYKKMCAYLEVRSWSDFEDAVESRGDHWDSDVYLYEGSWADYGEEMFRNMGYNLPEHLENFFDFEEYGRYIGSDYAEEYSEGIIEIGA